MKTILLFQNQPVVEIADGQNKIVVSPDHGARSAQEVTERFRSTMPREALGSPLVAFGDPDNKLSGPPEGDRRWGQRRLPTSGYH